MIEAIVFYKRRIFILLFFYCFLIVFQFSIVTLALAKPSINTYGVPGLIDMPSASSFSDGTMSINSAKADESIRTTLSFQALPRVSGIFRYSGIGTADWGYTSDSGYNVWDRSFDLRVNVLKEKNYLPEITIGLQDIIGTGAHSGEYLVASKAYKRFKGTMGLGWGRYASQNIISNNENRSSSNVGGSFGGLLRTEEIFRGNVGIFGGLEYDTPVNHLKFKMETSSDTYETVSHLRNKRPTSKINYALDYELNEFLNLSAYYHNGNSVGFNASFSISPLDHHSPSYLENTTQPFYSIPFPNLNEDKEFWKNLEEALKKIKINLIAHMSKTNEVILVIENNHYSTHTIAFGKTIRIMSSYIHKDKDIFTVILSENGVPITQISVDRNQTSMLVDEPNAELSLKKLVETKAAPKQIKDANVVNSQKNIDWFVNPYYSLHLFDPNRPIYYDIGPEVGFYYRPFPGISLSGSTETSLITTFDEVWRGEKGNLPKVRTQLKHYLNTTDTRIKDLTLSSYFKLSKDLYGRISTGLFEQMYAGLSLETLYFPYNSNLSFGIEVNKVKSRNYRQLFGLRELEGLSEINGHLSSYWNTNYKYYFAQLDVGKYLAGDRGSTFTLSRNFPNGWKVGGYFTLTDAEFADFGEGSFDKGIFFTIPFNSVSPYDTRYSISENIRPIQGDGGARVIVPGRLYDTLGPYSKKNLNDTWGNVWR